MGRGMWFIALFRIKKRFVNRFPAMPGKNRADALSTAQQFILQSQFLRAEGHGLSLNTIPSPMFTNLSAVPIDNLCRKLATQRKKRRPIWLLTMQNSLTDAQPGS